MAINVKLFQSTKDFRLLCSGVEKYKLLITDAILKVCHVSLNPSMIVAHNEALKLTPHSKSILEKQYSKFQC